MLKRSAITVAAAIGFLGIASPALAVQWGSASNPYVVKDGGVSQGKAYGDYGNYNNQYARSNAWYYDMRPGGEGIYVGTNFTFWYGGTVNSYTSVVYDETSRTTSAAWKYQYKQTYLREDSEKSRGVVKVCEDQSWSGDPCSATGLATFTY